MQQPGIETVKAAFKMKYPTAFKRQLTAKSYNCLKKKFKPERSYQKIQHKSNF
jgi:uncharacterized HAD superfamily protein